jgi:formylglycine-generating enzyme required for sulfatase activity
MYPWGNDFDTKRCNFNTNGTTPVMQYPNGASPYGVIDMSGNVWEWCLTSNETGNMSLSGVGARVLRGGSWRSLKSASLRASGRGWDTPESDHNFWGFRVVRFP